MSTQDGTYDAAEKAREFVEAFPSDVRDADATARVGRAWLCTVVATALREAFEAGAASRDQRADEDATFAELITERDTARADLASATARVEAAERERDEWKRSNDTAIQLYKDQETRHAADLRLGIDAALESMARDLARAEADARTTRELLANWVRNAPLAHRTSCLCVWCEDRRAFLAAAPPSAPAGTAAETCGHEGRGNKGRPCPLPKGHLDYCKPGPLDLGTREQQLARLDALGDEGHVGAGYDLGTAPAGTGAQAGEAGIIGRHWIEPSAAAKARPRSVVTSGPDPAVAARETSTLEVALGAAPVIPGELTPEEPPAAPAPVVPPREPVACPCGDEGRPGHPIGAHCNSKPPAEQPQPSGVCGRTWRRDGDGHRGYETGTCEWPAGHENIPHRCGPAQPSGGARAPFNIGDAGVALQRVAGDIDAQLDVMFKAIDDAREEAHARGRLEAASTPAEAPGVAGEGMLLREACVILDEARETLAAAGTWEPTGIEVRIATFVHRDDVKAALAREARSTPKESR